MNPLSWLRTHRHHLRIAILVLLLAALAGPWETSADGVPPAEWCARPNLLTDYGRCVRLVPGWQMLSFFVFAFLAALLTGQMTLAGRGSEIWIGFLLLLPLALPFLGTLLRFLDEKNQRFKLIQLGSFALAIFPAVVFAVRDTQESQIKLWGIWLFLVLAIAALSLESLVFEVKRT